MAKQIETEQKQLNTIKAGTNITGDINCNGDIRFEGGLVGNLNVQGRVVIGASGSIKGEINCKNAEIEGKIEGKIIVAELLSLKSTAAINGDIKTRRLAIEPGANFTGNCIMNGSAPISSPAASLPKGDDKKK